MVWKAGQSKNYVHGVCRSPVYPSLSRVSSVLEWGWVLESGVWSTYTGRGQLVAVKYSLKGRE